MRSTEALADARRGMQVCIPCRYCEGYCAVFPAMELRRSFSNSDLGYLANLCHDCRGCFYACQYAPPHVFGINLPKAFAQLRAQTYEDYAWPRPLARLFQRNALVVSLVTALALAAVLALTMLFRTPEVLSGARGGAAAFDAVIPYGVMLTLGMLTFTFSLAALAMGFANFWRDTGGRAAELAQWRPFWEATKNALALRNLDGGGYGCNYPDEVFSGARRWLHHAQFYGFLLCFAATSVAAVYDHLLGWAPPYAVFSAPVLLGTAGGIGLVIGAAGLLWLKVVSDPAPAARRLLAMDAALLVLLGATALSGLALLALRTTGAMAVLLAVHLGFVLALFLLLPYSKFVHGVYRFAALLRFSLERQAPGE